MVPSYLFGTVLTCHFSTLMQCAQQPRGSSLCGFHVVVSLSKWLAPIPVCWLSKIWTVYVYMKLTKVWYLDSAKQHPPLKFLDLQNVLNRSVSCRFCSQKFNLLVFLSGIADHARPLVKYFLFTKNQSLSVSNWYCWSCRAFGDTQYTMTKGKQKSHKPHSSTKQISL
jgi:hypothetical protein